VRTLSHDKRRFQRRFTLSEATKQELAIVAELATVWPGLKISAAGRTCAGQSLATSQLKLRPKSGDFGYGMKYRSLRTKRKERASGGKLALFWRRGEVLFVLFVARLLTSIVSQQSGRSWLIRGGGSNRVMGLRPISTLALRRGSDSRIRRPCVRFRRWRQKDV